MYNEEEKDKISNEFFKTFKLGHLTVEETREIVTLDYVLTWGYDQKDDERRYIELSKKRWG